MAHLGNFNANDVEPVPKYETLPAGEYAVVIVESEFQDNRAGTGRYLLLTFEVIDGQHKGRRLWARLNLEHPNPNAVRFARADLAAICQAVNVLAPSDSVDLHNLPLLIEVKTKRRRDTDELTNEISDYKPRRSGSPAPATAQTNSPDGSAPWKR